MVISAVDTTDLFSTDADADAAVNHSKQSLLNMDNMILFLMIGLSLFVLIAGYMSVNHPAMFFIAVFLLVIAIIFSAMISNSYQTVAAQSQISPAASLFPKLDFIMDNLPFYIVFMGFMTAILMYAGYSKYG